MYISLHRLFPAKRFLNRICITGSTVQVPMHVYNTLTGTIQPAALMNQWRYHYAMIMYGSNVLVCGGVYIRYGNVTRYFELLATCELFTPANNAWTAFESIRSRMTSESIPITKLFDMFLLLLF